MASGSPRGRIDKFFVSKKRKQTSPGFKSGRSKKHVKATFEGSPSAKGTLENCLVTSKDDNSPRSSYTVHDSLAGLDAVRRNLALEINNSSKDEFKQPLFSEELRPATSEAVEVAQNEASHGLSVMGEAAVGDLAKGSSKFPHGVDKSDLKKFAADFLSLYCSELKPSVNSQSEPEVNEHKRHYSLLCLDRMDKTSKKKCNTNGSHLEGEFTCSKKKNLEDMQPGDVDKTVLSVFSSSREVIDGDSPVDLQPCLKKCSNTPKSSVNMTELRTPGSLTVKACSNETPKSIRGSSIFSPGEAFWNEAIQVADGLCAPQAAEETHSTTRDHVLNLCNLRNGVCHNNSMKTLNEDEERAWNMELSASLGSLGKHAKDLHKEVSPLPVKHFDFSCEGKNLNESTSHHHGVDGSKCATHKGSEQSECGSVNVKGLETSNILIRCDKAHSDEKLHEVQEMTSTIVINKEAGGMSCPDNGCMTSNSPVNEIKNLVLNHESDEASTPSSFLRLEDRSDLHSWLPSEICSTYRKRGISKLYPWQVECLQVDGVLQRRNLVYCASTSAGKSFVAEILMLRRVISTGKMALLVLPYVSICTEKAEHLEVLLEPLGKHVRSYYGNQGGGTLPKDTSVAVCTIEKANSLINRLLEEGRLSEIGIIVIDELHMVGDPSRGYLLELMLTKLRYAAGEGNSESSSGESSGRSSGKADPANGLQIVGMSATMPNVAAVADWLQAALYQTDFRPVPLEEYIKVGNTVYSKKMDIVRTISKAADLGGKDPDHIVELCNEVVQEGHSVLIFCSSRKGCESTARHVAKFLERFSVNVRNNESEFVDITSAIDALRRCPVGLDPILEETFPSGVAYHHAGLTVEEREVVETCYRRGLLRVLTATSTLAAGVNLPARRVIFRQPRIGRDFIDGTRYKQMAGRAGRTGMDAQGESVLICKPEEIKRIMGLLNETCPPLHSCLSEDVNGMTHAILEVVAGGIVQTANDIHRYVRCTLLNSTKPFQDVVKSAQESLRWLCHSKFLEWNEDTKLYSTTPLGRAAFGSSLCPEESLIVLDDLSRAREGFVLASDLHLVYLVTPINVDVEPDWELYYERFMELSALDQSVGNRVGVVEPFLMRMAHGAPMRSSNQPRDLKRLQGKHENKFAVTNSSILSDDQMRRVCKRFYVALILSRLVQEVPVVEVCEAFKVARGMVQTLQENAGRFASMVTMFCERLGWHDLEGLVAKFQNRVSFGVRAEIVELTSIPYVKGSRARSLYKAGLRTPLAIAEASIPEIVKALFESSSWAAQEGSAQRRVQLGVAKKIKNGARKIVLDKAEEARVVAFSAFKSLGFNVPHFSRPLMSTTVGDQVRQGTATTSFGIDTSSNFDVVEHMNHISSKPSMEENDNSDKVTLESEGEKLIRRSDIDLLASEEVNSTAAVHCNFGTETSVVPVEGSVTSGAELNDTVGNTKSADITDSIDLKKPNAISRIGDGYLYCGVPEPHNILSLGIKNSVCGKGPINAISTPGGFDSFLDLWETAQEFYFDVHYNKRLDVNSVAPFEIHGIATCWENSPVYYVNLPKDLMWSDKRREDYSSMCISGDKSSVSLPENWSEIVERRWNRIREILGKRNVRKFTWNLKVQIQVLKIPAVLVQKFGSDLAGKNTGLELIDNSYLLLSPVNINDGIDMSIVTWILWPDEERSSNPNLEKEVKKRLSSEAAATANQSGRWKNQMRRAAHNGCCCRVAQTRALCSALWKLLLSEELIEALMNIETPLVNVLADMELWGIGVDMDGCLQARNVLAKKLRHLEKEAYKLAGMTFSLYTAADIANVLYGHLKLPIPEGHNMGKQHPSTDKHCLDLLRHEHPIIPVIKEHRTLAKLLNCTLGSICSMARLSVRTHRYTLHGHWLQTSTATGRLSMEEPNLQCVEHVVDFKMNKDKDGDDTSTEPYKINARDFFVPTQDNWLLLTADYSQIELRLMAHFSKDSSLIELLSKPHGDVFTMIAAKWTGKPEDSVDSNERDQTKRLVYGILYGMGVNTLAEQLHCSSGEAAEKIQSFKSSFPGVASWLHEAIASCRQKGYVETLKGRKRFLSKIKFGNNKERSKAQRQAVNSICQGSAADIIKIAMINIYSVIAKGVDKPDSGSLATQFEVLKGRCQIVLQVHDELVLEVDPSVTKEAALLLQMSMENAALLLVPLHIKLKVGRTWGSLEPYQADQF
ncbi:helicase and polymerase-containing protein TEBICHI isoform X2 [Juglans microcarpa x Juglans regia]|uniref:helicase and polymerase-containing protein TEBICHI isoform X2 n=1 Tax=Juglans microcarpa x Juglans regia TaxID=2249226 RepID=UPI001B7DAA78|nr:helicase and polymerase-containing protein TEBICHI isoform X2 [Juglans microcarpa x Juglans regia]